MRTLSMWLVCAASCWGSWWEPAEHLLGVDALREVLAEGEAAGVWDATTGRRLALAALAADRQPRLAAIGLAQAAALAEAGHGEPSQLLELFLAARAWSDGPLFAQVWLELQVDAAEQLELPLAEVHAQLARAVRALPELDVFQAEDLFAEAIALEVPLAGLVDTLVACAADGAGAACEIALVLMTVHSWSGAPLARLRAMLDGLPGPLEERAVALEDIADCADSFELPLDDAYAAWLALDAGEETFDALSLVAELAAASSRPVPGLAAALGRVLAVEGVRYGIEVERVFRVLIAREDWAEAAAVYARCVTVLGTAGDADDLALALLDGVGEPLAAVDALATVLAAAEGEIDPLRIATAFSVNFADGGVPFDVQAAQLTALLEAGAETPVALDVVSAIAGEARNLGVAAETVYAAYLHNLDAEEGLGRFTRASVALAFVASFKAKSGLRLLDCAELWVRMRRAEDSLEDAQGNFELVLSVAGESELGLGALVDGFLELLAAVGGEESTALARRDFNEKYHQH